MIYYGLVENRVKIGFTDHLAKRLRTHRGERLHWATLGFHDGDRAYEATLHRWAESKGLRVSLFGERELFHLNDDLLHVIYHECVEVHAGELTDAFWQLWEPLHDLNVRRYCRHRNCKERAA